MPLAIFGADAAVAILNRAFNNSSPANSLFNSQVKAATAALKSDANPSDPLSYTSFAKTFGASFANQKPADLAKLLLTNLGVLPAPATATEDDKKALTALETDVAKYIEAQANGTGDIGIIALQAGVALSGLENGTGAQAIYSAMASAWNAEVTESFMYSANPVNTTPSSTTQTGNEAAKSLVLTVNQDVLTGGAGADVFRAVAGAMMGNQDQTTLNSSDILDGGKGNDQLIVNMTGPAYNGGARIKNIETLTIGNNVGTTLFDFNVNEGSNEVEGVATIEYDQINTGEVLTVNNILKQTVVTVGADGKETSATAIPTLLFDNEAGSTAGRIVANFRASAVSGATEVNVQLDDVARGQMDIGGGVETIVISSQGSTRNTLNASTNVDGAAVDIVSGSNDGVNDNGALTKVVVKGAQAFGQAPGVITDDSVGQINFGFTNHAVNGDLGLDNNLTSASNLSSVAATVTEVDASAADGGVAMTFVGRVDNLATNVKFTGGKAADFVVFQKGNVNAAGGEGADTFAFLNTIAITNFDFGSADSIVGGAGADTIMLGLNGVGTVVANTTEFNNKTGIETLDLRGQTNTVTLADAFVAAADVGTFTVRTDRIVQTSDTSTANPTPSNATNNAGRENASVNTIVLTELADNRAIEFIGGSGSDRVVVDNASANASTKLDGGTNALAGSNDSLTVVNTSVLDANDVANIKNFEVLNLVEIELGNNTFNVSLSEAFVLANSTTTVPLTVVSVTNTYGQRLAAGDVVNLEVSDLLNGAAAKTSIAGRVVNVQDLIAAGVTVNFQQNGTTIATNAAPAALAANLNLVTAPAATVLDDVPGATVAPPGVTVANVGGVGATNGTVSNDVFGATAAIANTDTVSGLAGMDTLNITFAADHSFDNVTGIELITLDASLGNTTLNNLVDNVIASGTTLTVNASAMGAGGYLLASFASESNGSVNFTATSNTDTITGGQGADTIDGGANTDTIDGGAGNDSLMGGLGADSVTGGAGNDTVNGGAGDDYVDGGAGNDVLNGDAGADTITAGTGSDTIDGGAGPDIIDLTGAGTHMVNGGADNDSITVGTGASTVDGGAGADNITVTASAVTAGSGAWVTLQNFNADADKAVGLTTAATSIIAATVANADMTNLISQATTALGANLGVNRVYDITVTAGTAAGRYFIYDYNTAGLGNEAGDIVMKVVGVTGTVDAGDFLA